MMLLVLPASMTVYSLLNLSNWMTYEMTGKSRRKMRIQKFIYNHPTSILSILTGYTSAAIHFFQVLVTLILRISCYSLIILLVKGYASLRVDFSKMEWRTLLGLVMFGTMGDLISEASDTKDWRSYVRDCFYAL